MIRARGHYGQWSKDYRPNPQKQSKMLCYYWGGRAVKETMRKTTNIARHIALHPDQKRHILSKHWGNILPTGCSIINSLSLSREWGQLQEKGDPQMRRYPGSAWADCRSRVSASRNLLWGQSLQTIGGAALETHVALECMGLFVSSAQLRKGSHSTEKTSRSLNVLHLGFHFQEPMPGE